MEIAARRRPAAQPSVRRVRHSSESADSVHAVLGQQQAGLGGR